MRSKPIRRMMWGVLEGLALWLAPHAHAQCQYTIEVVTGPECPPLGTLTVQFNGLNEHGQACGWQSKCSVPNGSDKLPIVWTEEQGIMLLPLPEGATRGEANDINDVLGSDGFGQVACTLNFDAPIFAVRAALYDDGTWTILEPEGSGTHTAANAINDDGWVAGYRDSGVGRMAMRWRDGQIQEVPSPTGGEAISYDIDALSVVTGTLGGTAFYWGDVRPFSIPVLPDATETEGRGINLASEVAGTSIISPRKVAATRRSWWYSEKELIDLGLLPNAIHAFAKDVNDAEQIVGYCFGAFGGGEKPFIWQAGVMTNLNTVFEFPDGFAGLVYADAINNHGQIAGTCAILDSGSYRGFVLTPIDRPLGDINLDCKVNGEDLALVLGDWGPCAQTGSCLCDIVTNSTFQPPGDGVVDGADLAVVLGNWTGARTAIRKR